MIIKYVKTFLPLLFPSVATSTICYLTREKEKKTDLNYFLYCYSSV